MVNATNEDSFRTPSGSVNAHDVTRGLETDSFCHLLTGEARVAGGASRRLLGLNLYEEMCAENIVIGIKKVNNKVKELGFLTQGNGPELIFRIVPGGTAERSLNRLFSTLAYAVSGWHTLVASYAV